MQTGPCSVHHSQRACLAAGLNCVVLDPWCHLSFERRDMRKEKHRHWAVWNKSTAAFPRLYWDPRKKPVPAWTDMIEISGDPSYIRPAQEGRPSWFWEEESKLEGVWRTVKRGHSWEGIKVGKELQRQCWWKDARMVLVHLGRWEWQKSEMMSCFVPFPPDTWG